MKTSALFSAAAATAVLFWSGCSVEETVTVQNLDLSGPQSYPHIHITNDSTNAPHAAVHLSTRTASPINGTFTNPSTTGSGATLPNSDPGKVRWTLPPVEGGVDLDIPVSRVIALTAGASASDNHWGFNAGIGFRTQEGNAAARLDLGFEWQELAYNVNYTVTTTTSSIFGDNSTSQKFQKSESASHGDFYASLTLNTTAPTGSLNGFFQIGYSHQTLFDYENRTLVFPVFGWSDKEAVNSSSLSLIPGLYFNVSASIRIVAGAKCMWVVGLDSSDPSFRAEPVLLFDFAF